MKKIKVAINGFGRIGRMVTRSIMGRYQDTMEIVAINDLTDSSVLSHLFKYDSTQGMYDKDVTVSNENSIVIDGHHIHVHAERNPENLPWQKYDIDVVVEATGFFCEKEQAERHLKAGAKKVIISAPAKGGVSTIVLGVNDDTIKSEVSIYSNASCTTNCLAPMVKVLDDMYGVAQGYMTTVHAYTGDQRLLDAPHNDLRRARSAAVNICPTTTGAAKAVALVLPHLEGKLDGGAIRVPVSSGSLTDFVVSLKTSPTSVADVNKAFQNASNTYLKNILQYSTDPLVSTDIIGNTHSCIYDALLTKVMGNMVKVIGWYDNEAGYSARTADLIARIS